MHGNMVFSRDSIFPNPQQSGCLLACSDDIYEYDDTFRLAEILIYHPRYLLSVTTPHPETELTVNIIA